jgi:hypothetical protein
MAEQWFWAQGVNLAQVEKVLADSRLRWVYAERMEDTVLASAEQFRSLSISLEQWTHGRAFGEDIEIAWWVKEDAFELRAYAQDGKPPRLVETMEDLTSKLKGLFSQDNETPLQDWQLHPQADQLALDTEERIQLVGELESTAPKGFQGPVWATARIPRYLDYPVEAGKPERVAMVRAVYSLGGMRREQRLVRLEGV